MQEFKSEIKIPLTSILGINLCIYANVKDSIIETDLVTAEERGESCWQLLEGRFYNYFFESENNECSHIQIKENAVIKNSLRSGVSEGRISPNIYVGSLPLEIYKTDDSETEKIIETVYVEVLPTKLDAEDNLEKDRDYRTNYEYMLGDIAEKCTELLLQIESPVYQNFEIDFNKNPQTIYQRFAFIRSLLNNDEFHEAVLKIISSPTSKWTVESELTSTLRLRRIGGKTMRKLISGNNRIRLNRSIGNLNSVPVNIENTRKVETFDTHENRFIKYVLQTFLQFIGECENAFSKNNYEKSKKEASALAALLENHLNHPFFLDISRPTNLKLNSPALQRKSGYRELLNAWLKFDLSLRLIWSGGDDVYKAGKRDIAVLYEYWLFFQLYDLMKEKFEINKIKHGDNDSYSHLIEESKDGLQLMIKSGSFTALEGKYISVQKELLNITFNYNKTFEGKVSYEDKKEGSWTKDLRPDYTLSIWPSSLTSANAEDKEQIVHIHFDSKYKVQNFTISTKVVGEIKDDNDINETKSEIDSLTQEKINERKGIYKNADLMKMHAYKDAIRRTGGAYILYPGTENPKPSRGFHEIIPGLGAFAIRPKNPNESNPDNGINELSKFIDDVIKNFKNSASQQKKYAVKTYETFIDKPSSIVKESLPHDLIPDESYVILGYFKSQKHLKWCVKNSKYNFRIYGKGSIDLNEKTINPKYLFLKLNRPQEFRLFRVKNEAPSVYNKVQLGAGYPNSRDTSDKKYLVFGIEKKEDFKFENEELEKRFKALKGNDSDKKPITKTLTDFLNAD